jgi:hypothetical protein
MLSKIGENLTKKNTWLITAAIATFMTIKIGIHPIGTGWIEIVKVAYENLPNQANYMSTSPVPLILFSFLGGSYVIWWGFHSILFMAWTLIGLNYLFRKFPDFKILSALIFLGSPLWLSLLVFIGHYDLFTIGGASLAVFARNRYLKIFGIILAAGANPEQAVVTSILILLLSAVLGRKDVRKLGFSYLAISVSVYLLARMGIQPVDNAQRISVITSELPESIRTSLGIWTILPMVIAGSISIMWFIFGYEVLSRWKLIVTAGIVFLIPTTFAFFISDKSRVGIAISAAVMMITWKIFLEHAQSNGMKPTAYHERIGLAVILLLLTPSLYIDRLAEFRLPYKEFIDLLM